MNNNNDNNILHDNNFYDSILLINISTSSDI